MNTPAMNSAQALREQVEALLDVWDDGRNPAELRAYVQGSFAKQMEEVRALLASPNSAQPPEPAAPTDHLGFFGIRLETIYRRHRVPFAVTVEIDNAYDILVRALATTRPPLDPADEASRHETERPG